MCVVVRSALAVFLFYYRPQTGGVCPSGGVFFPFVSERKRNQKEREFKGCALKNPPIVQSWYAQSKTTCLSLPKLQVALRAMKLYEAGKGQKVGATIGRPRLRRAFAVRMNSDGQNSFSHYVDLTSSAHEPSALDRRSQCNLNRRSSVARGRLHYASEFYVNITWAV